MEFIFIICIFFNYIFYWDSKCIHFWRRERFWNLCCGDDFIYWFKFLLKVYKICFIFWSKRLLIFSQPFDYINASFYFFILFKVTFHHIIVFIHLFITKYFPKPTPILPANLNPINLNLPIGPQFITHLKDLLNCLMYLSLIKIRKLLLVFKSTFLFSCIKYNIDTHKQQCSNSILFNEVVTTYISEFLWSIS